MKTFLDELITLEAEIDQPACDYEKLIVALRRLRIPAVPSASELERLYQACFRVLNIQEAGSPLQLPEGISDSARNHLMVLAREKIYSTLYDSNGRRAAQRRLENRRDPAARAANTRRAPTFTCPFPRDEAVRQIAPFLRALEASLEHNPYAHVSLAWAMERSGYPPFQGIIMEWMTRCDARGLGAPSTAPAVVLAHSLCGEAEALEERAHTGGTFPRWDVMERRILPLLKDPNRLVAAHAARVIGAWYSGAGNPNCPAIADVLQHIASLPEANAAVAGGFINGFDTECTGLATLADALPDEFDLDTWCIDILAEDPEPTLPGVQAFWFYVHEYYDHSPGFVHRLIDRGLNFVALMCATEWREPVAGMDGALRRLAVQRDRAIAARAFDHLAEIYSGHTTWH